MAVSSPHTYGVAVVQQPPVLLDRSASLERALATIDEAVGGGAQLVTFPEAYLPGYPEYIWRLLPGADYDLSRELHGRLVANAVDLASDDLLPIREAARRHGIVVIIGIHERDAAFSRATDRFYPDPDEWLNPGDSVIVAPGGAVVAGPLHAEHGILYADCDPAAADAGHYTLDAAGHYNRPDIFSLTVQRAGATQIVFDDGAAGPARSAGDVPPGKPARRRRRPGQTCGRRSVSAPDSPAGGSGRRGRARPAVAAKLVADRGDRLRDRRLHRRGQGQPDVDLGRPDPDQRCVGRHDPHQARRGDEIGDPDLVRGDVAGQRALDRIAADHGH
jgi:hypothetical protein